MSKLLHITPGSDFLSFLSRGLLERFGDTPEQLMHGLVILPTRRACRNLTRALQQEDTGRARFLPTIAPVDSLPLPGQASLEHPRAISEMSGAMIAARQLTAASRQQAINAMSKDRAYRLGRDLFKLLDLLAEYEIDWDMLRACIPEHLSIHWQTNITFFGIVMEHWPEILAASGECMPSTARNLAMQTFLQAQMADRRYQWICLAGLKPGHRATSMLLAEMKDHEQAFWVTEGDFSSSRGMTDAPLTTSHPLHEHQQLLQLAGLNQAPSQAWSSEQAHQTASARAGLILAAMDSETPQDHATNLHDALSNLRLLEAKDPAAEALGIALLMRDRLDHKRADGTEQTAMLIAPDRNLARRVALELRRFDIMLDESAGTPLDQTAAGGFLLLVAHLLADGPTPIRLLEVLKHPLAASGSERGKLIRIARDLDQDVLRGPAPPPTFAALIDGLSVRIATLQNRRTPDTTMLERWRAMQTWLEALDHAHRSALARLSTAEHSLPDIMSAHLEFAEWLATDGGLDHAPEGKTPAGQLWEKEAGEAARDLMDAMSEHGEDLGVLALAEYPPLLATIMADIAVRKRFSGHPRLSIVGQVEGRLSSADLVILGGLNEGVWPRHVDSGPWLNHSMRQRLGLPDLTVETGRSAHDFMMAFCAESVVLSRSLKDSSGKPTVESPLLARLKATLQTLGPSTFGQDASSIQFDTSTLDQHDRPPSVTPAGQPCPVPPLSARPTTFKTTEIGEWVTDPYAIYARKILQLPQLDALASDAGARERGLIFHAVLEEFVKSFPAELPTNAFQLLLKEGAQLFDNFHHMPEVHALWWPRFREAMSQILQEERRRRDEADIFPEISGDWRYHSEQTSRDYLLRCKADRIERLANGQYRVIDYKTGKPPTAPQVRAGFYPQLPIEAMMLQRGDFPAAKKGTVESLEYWHVSGRYASDAKLVHPCDTEKIKEPIALEDLIVLTEKRIVDLIRRYEKAETSYPSKPFGGVRGSMFHDYDHLARRGEWVVDDPDGSEDS